MHTTTKRRASIKLRRTEWDRRMTAKGLTSCAARAEAIGVSRWNVSRIENGDVTPGGRFIAAVLLAHPDLKFEDLFEIEEVEISDTDPTEQEDE